MSQKLTVDQKSSSYIVIIVNDFYKIKDIFWNVLNYVWPQREKV